MAGQGSGGEAFGEAHGGPHEVQRFVFLEDRAEGFLDGRWKSGAREQEAFQGTQEHAVLFLLQERPCNVFGMGFLSRSTQKCSSQSTRGEIRAFEQLARCGPRSCNLPPVQVIERGRQHADVSPGP